MIYLITGAFLLVAIYLSTRKKFVDYTQTTEKNRLEKSVSHYTHNDRVMKTVPLSKSVFLKPPAMQKLVAHGSITTKERLQFLDQILTAHSSYYRNLDKTYRFIFARRVNMFISETEFIPCHIETITEEMKIFIASAAVQVSFGLGNFLSTKIKAVRVYPDVYYSKLLRQYLKGHFHPKGYLFLSYKTFESGFADGEDGINLGLHETAHALHFCMNSIFEFPLLIGAMLDKWSNEVHNDVTNGNKPALYRKYAFTNIQEFFAVTVELFFERAKDLHEHYPQIYRNMAIVLNQNPANLPIAIGENFNPEEKGRLIFKEKTSNILLYISFIVLTAVYSGGIVLILNKAATVVWVFIMQYVFFAFFILFFMFTKIEMRFYDNCIELQKTAVKSNRIIIPTGSILYVATYIKTKGRNSTKRVMSFVWYKNDLSENIDTLPRSKKFREQVKQYCKEREIMFIEKA